jgi:hypothetical protein
MLMGRMVRAYVAGEMGIFFRESRRVVVRARIWVAKVAKPRCHVVRRIAV